MCPGRWLAQPLDVGIMFCKCTKNKNGSIGCVAGMGRSVAGTSAGVVVPMHSRAERPSPARRVRVHGAESNGSADGNAVDAERRRGRGAVSNAAGRFVAHGREIFDDGWESAGMLEAFQTHVRLETAKSVIARNTSPDISFDRSINPYRGCEHGCIYCYARPTHAYWGLSPGLDFETRLTVKENAAEALAAELAKPGYVPQTIALGTITDPYQPIEREHRITRQVLEVLEASHHPVGIVTKSALVLRDLDILSRMAQRGLVKVALSVTTLDHRLARKLEPRATTPTRRIQAIHDLSAAGVPTCVMTAPLIPALNDHELESILTEARAAGAREAGFVMLRLPLEIHDLFKEWLREHFPDRADRVLNHVRAMHDGKAYDGRFFHRQTGAGPYARLIALRFKKALARLGFVEERCRLRTDLFVAPPSPGARHKRSAQWDLFGAPDDVHGDVHGNAQADAQTGGRGCPTS